MTDATPMALEVARKLRDYNRPAIEAIIAFIPGSSYTQTEPQPGFVAIIADALRAHAAQAVEGYQNALTAMEAYLEPEWSEARAEVLANGNAGWTMMAKLAIEKRAAPRPDVLKYVNPPCARCESGEPHEHIGL